MYIKIEELEKILNEEFKEQLHIKITGLIDFEIKTDNITAFLDEEKLWLISKTKREVGINRHQIINIYIENSIIKIKLDYLLDISLIKA